MKNKYNFNRRQPDMQQAPRIMLEEWGGSKDLKH